MGFLYVTTRLLLNTAGKRIRGQEASSDEEDDDDEVQSR